MALAVAASPAHAVVFDNPAFEARTLVSPLDKPTSIAWTPDGRMFIAEKAGVLKVLAPGAQQPVQLLDIRDRVGNQSDRGLLGLAVDSAYTTNNYVYLLYARDTGLMDDDDGPMVAQLARYRISPTNVVSDETLLLGTHVPASGGCPAPGNTVDCIPSDGTSHSIGTVRSAPDGTLWVGSGDAAPYGGVDLLALRSYDEQSLAGKIMHIDRNGNGLPGHPFCPANSNLTNVCTKLHAKGFRNPFRFHLRPNGAGLAVGDVGWNSREEMDLVPLTGGKSYGWPCYEGTIQTPGYKDLPECAAEYAKPAGTHLGPAYDYPNGTANASLGGPVYTATNYPGPYQGKLYHGDAASGVLQRLTINAQDQVTAVEPYATQLNGVDVELGPNGNLVNVSMGTTNTGKVQEFVYTPGNASPTAAASGTPTSGAAPLQVQFSSAGTGDPDQDPLTYEWDFGDGSAHSTGAAPGHLYTTPGNYTVTLTVRDGRGGSDTATVSISAGNTPPGTPTISTPADESLYRDGTSVALNGSATDPQEGALPASALSWEVVLHHAEHTHPLTEIAGTASTSFNTLVDHDADSFYEITLTATDAGGLTSSRTIQIRPQTAQLTLASSPPGAPVSYAGSQQSSPFTTQAAVGFETTISADAQFERQERTYRFVGWSDGGTRLHNISIPTTTQTLTASYEDITPGTITIQKQTDPAGAPDQFDFTGGAPIGAFTLTSGQARTVSAAPGTYTVAELPEAQWDLTDISCSDGDSTSAGATATIRVSAAEAVTCTYSNARSGTITIEKQTVPDGAAGRFSFIGGLGSFDLGDGQTRTVGIGPGTYSVTERGKGGWDLHGVECSDGDSSEGITSLIRVSAGEAVRCVFTNVKRGKIKVKAVTDPPKTRTQGVATFAFSGEPPLDNFELGADQTRVEEVPPGTYEVTQEPAKGYTLRELGCDDSDSEVSLENRLATVRLAADESVTCTFTAESEQSGVLGDGSGPVVSFSPRRGLNKRRNRLSGSVRDSDGVKRLLVAVGRPAAGRSRCRWWSKRTRSLASTAARCGKPRWMRAKLSGRGAKRRWRVGLGAPLPPGRYRVAFKAIDGEGNVGRHLAGGGKVARLSVRRR